MNHIIVNFLHENVNHVVKVKEDPDGIEVWLNGDKGIHASSSFKEWLKTNDIPFTRLGLYRFLLDTTKLVALIPEEPEDPRTRQLRMESEKIERFKATLTTEQLAQFEEIQSFSFSAPYA